MSSSQNNLILSGFNNQFSDFMEDIHAIFPDNKDVISAKTSLGYLRKLNPKLILGFWKGYIVPRYQGEIEAGDCKFFLQKDYSLDVGSLTDGSSASDIIVAIDRIRSPLSQLSDANLDKCIQYLQNLTKLALLYEG